MKTRPKLSFWQIWNMSFGFFGIQFGFALQNANVSRIFETLGAKIEDIPILWIAAPVTGLIVQPIIGHMSDNTWGKLGRRRPYFLIGAILASLALFIMPNSPFLWIAAGMFWIMDAAINVSMEPFRAFVGDMLPTEQRTKGFAMQSFFIGTGAVIASALPYVMTNFFDVSNISTADSVIPPSVKWSFYLGGAIFFISVLWTVFSTKEYSPEELKEFSDSEKETKSLDSDEIVSSKLFKRNGIIYASIGAILCSIVYLFSLEQELYILTCGITVFGFIQLYSCITREKESGLVVVMSDLLKMPKTMRQLSIVQFFSWLALFSMWIYTTSAVTSHIYGTNDTSSALYNEGADWVGILFAVYNGFAAIVSFLLPVIAKHTNRKITHMISLIAGGIGLISFYFITDPYLLIVSMFGVGMAWASILSMPYAILTGSIPSNKMGVYMGIFNFFIVIPQILAASILGFITKYLFHGNTIFSLVFGGIAMLIAAATVLFVNDEDYKK